MNQGCAADQNCTVDQGAKALLLSAYDAQSHRYWREQLCAGLNQWQWSTLCLAPRFFSWRQRGNSLTWAFNERELLTQPYDFLLATSMVDLSALRGFVPELAGVPSVVYFHENQFAYPTTSQQYRSVEPQLTSIYSALCADQLLFNSQFNLDSFMLGAKKLLKAMPDQVPKGLIECLGSKAQVLPVPISAFSKVGALLAEGSSKSSSQTDGSAKRKTLLSKRLNILWNHRWEYDKGPERLLAVIACLDGMLRSMPADRRPEICWTVLGQSFRQQPAEFEKIQTLLNAADSPMGLNAWGYESSHTAYNDHLEQADVVLSTAEHDFQGLSILEAYSCGCYPLVPNRLVYPEWFGAKQCYPSLDVQAEAQALSHNILHLTQEKAAQGYLQLPECKMDFSWLHLGPKYQKCFTKLAHS